MFDKHSDYALNKVDKEAIVCPSATGVHIRLTREDFATEDEFLYWKQLSDSDYKDMESAGRVYYDNCVSLAEARKSTGTSAEDVFFAPLLKAEQREEKIAQLRQVKSALTKIQYRRMWLHFVDGMSVKQIAQQDGVTFQAVYACLAKASKIVNNL